MENQLKVLVVDSEKDRHDKLFAELGEAGLVGLHGSVALLSALSQREAEDLFFAHRAEIAAVVVTPCVPGEEPNTVPLVRKLREAASLTMPMIVVSNDVSHRQLLAEAGCNAVATRASLVKTLVWVLDL
jgi:hypothetical protein